MSRYKIIFTVIVVILIAACSQSIPFDYTEADLKKVAQGSYSYFPVSLQDQYDKSDVTVDSVCEVDERTLTTNNYNHVFIVQLEDENLSVGLNKGTENVEMVGNFSSSDICEKI